MPKAARARTTPSRRQAGVRRTSNQEGALQDLGIHGTDIVLDGVDKKMFSAFEELDISQRFIWPTRELNTNLPKAIRKDEKQRQRASNRKWRQTKGRARQARHWWRRRRWQCGGSGGPRGLKRVHLGANLTRPAPVMSYYNRVRL